MIDPAAQEVLDFWFGKGHDVQRPEWFRKDPAFDAQIRERFGPLVEQALQGGLAEWPTQAPSALARIVLLDQFTRNIHRDSAKAFAGDAHALAAARAMVATGQDRALRPVQRLFVYLPFEHAENLSAQDEAVRLFSALGDDAPELKGLMEWVRRHRDVIQRFGRFPHRNAVLGRDSTPEERAFLLEPGSRF